MRRLPEINRDVIQNFILHITHCNGKGDMGFEDEMTFTPEQLYKMANDYIEEDHVDGYGREREYVLQLGIDAEILKRNGETQKGDILHKKFNDEYMKSHPDDQVYINQQLPSQVFALDKK